MSRSAFLFRNFVYYPVSGYMAGPVRGNLRFLERTQYNSRADLDALQARRLATLLDGVSGTVPFFEGIPRPQVPDEPALSVLGRLPFLTKSDLQTRSEALRSRAGLGRLATKTTGGSTGEPVTIWKTRSAWAWELAATWRGYGWAGIQAGDLQARFWGVPQESKARWRAAAIDAVCNRIRIPAFSFSEADMDRYESILNRRRPPFFYGYVSMLTEFAGYLNGRGRRLTYTPRAVVTTSEVLDPASRKILEEVFGAPVFNEYGCGELGTIAHECTSGALHLSEENMIIEICAGDRRCGPGESGEIVATELNNQAFPLIRYRTGDFGFVAPAPCACGRTLAVLGSVHGRAYDFVRNRKGQLFHGEFIMYIFEDLRRRQTGIKQFQVEQVDLESFRVRIVRAADYDRASEDLIIERIRGHVDPEARVTFEYVDEIHREQSGKLRLIKGLGA
ncbi:MAG: phenylacetate--CoA ligase family protein [bacterium]|nr:phenylacetate--CoA ligase family protein [bacterium]MBK7672364.1 phenylacetate--CoA ligase family protein [bacterium]